MKPHTEIVLEGGTKIRTRNTYEVVLELYKNALGRGDFTFEVLNAAGGFDTYPEDAEQITIVTDKVVSVQRLARA